jgi:hypothetical protein
MFRSQVFLELSTQAQLARRDIITLESCHMTREADQVVPPFHQRFNIKVRTGEAQERFVNRVISQVKQHLGMLEEGRKPGHYAEAMYHAAIKLGTEYNVYSKFSHYVEDDFYNCLIALEAIYEVFVVKNTREAEQLPNLIQYAISLSEIDLGIEWRDGVFWPSGAKLLDEALVNENLKWLVDKGYQDILVPFEKGLRHFIEATQKPERLGDTVTDVYEAVEALAKRVTGKNRDLSKNAELFIKELKLSQYYKKMLKDYIDYANNYRHAAELGIGKKPLLRNEVEAFIYTSGLFIRLAVQQLA